MNKIDKRRIVFDIYDKSNIPFGRWGHPEVDHLFVMRWSDNVDIENNIIGYIGIDICGNKIPTVSYSFMRKLYRGKGLGLFMYENAVNTFDKLSTRYSGTNHAISSDAIKVWNKLKLKYKTRISKNKNIGMVVYSKLKKDLTCV